MKKILVCQHVPYEILGTLNPLFKKAGFRIRYLNFGRFPEATTSLEGYHGMVILGGPMNMDQMKEFPHLKHEMELVEEALKRDLPVMGICLGAQIIAKTLGAEVKKNKEKEIGWYDVSLTQQMENHSFFKNFSTTEKIFQWHGDTFDIPRGALHLASTPTCKNQAFSYGEKVVAMQFHLEVDEAMIKRWLQVPRHVEELKNLKGKINPEVIRQETPQHINRLKNLGQQTFKEFIKLFGVEKKYHRLPSR